MRQVTARIRKTEPIPENVRPKASWGRFFSRSFGFSISPFKKYSMSVFFDKRLSAASSKNRPAFLQKTEQVVTRCISCVGEEWELRAEPLSSDVFGLVMYTRRGKAIASGIGRLSETGFQCKLATLYDGITNEMKITYGASVSTNTQTGATTVGVTVTATDPRT